MTRRALRMTHPHTGLPLEPVGFRADGRPIWPILGASDDGEGGDGGDGASGSDGGDGAGGDDGSSDDGADALGDKGKKAIDRMKADKKAAEQKARDEAARADALQAKLDGKEAEHAAAQEAQRVKDEALAAANQRILKAEVRAAAAGKLADPADALRFIDLSALEVGADGEVDSDAVAAAVDDLIKDKPYLAAQGRRFQGDADGGARKESQPAQLSKADVERMYANKQYDEIEKARQEGRLKDVLGATN